MSPSETAAPWYAWDGERLILRVHVQARASRGEIVGPLGGRLKVRITAPPVDGQANKYLIRFLAGELKVAASRINLLAGTSDRYKRLEIKAPKQLPSGIIKGETG